MVKLKDIFPEECEKHGEGEVLFMIQEEQNKLGVKNYNSDNDVDGWWKHISHNFDYKGKRYSILEVSHVMTVDGEVHYDDIQEEIIKMNEQDLANYVLSVLDKLKDSDTETIKELERLAKVVLEG